MGGPIILLRDGTKIVLTLIGQNWLDIWGVISNVTLLGDMFNLIIRAVTEIPKDIAACSGLVSDATQSVGFIMKLINPATLLTNLGTNALTHIMDILNDLWQLTIAAVSFKFCDVGHYMGDLVIKLLA